MLRVVTYNIKECRKIKFCMLRVVLVCKLKDNTVNERFKYQCSIVCVFNIYAALVLKTFIYSIVV